jgi:hypothetical protein
MRRDALSRIERGKVRPLLASVEKLIKVFGLELLG